MWKEVGMEVNMKLSTRKRYRVGKQLLGNSTAGKAKRLRIMLEYFL